MSKAELIHYKPENTKYNNFEQNTKYSHGECDLIDLKVKDLHINLKHEK